MTLAFLHAHPVEVARRLETLPPEDACAILSPLPPPMVAAVMEYLLPASAAAIAQQLPRDHAVEVITALSSPSSLGVLRHLDRPLQDEFLDRLEPALGASLRLALKYPERTGGALADPRVLTLPPDITVADALSRVARDSRRATYYLYVIDRQTKLVGVVTIKELLAADPKRPVASVMNEQVATLSANAGADELRQHPQWGVHHTMPVVDGQRRFLGALRYQTVRRIEEEATVNQTPVALSQALIKLWEFYSMTGIRIMTDLAEAMSRGTTVTPSDQPRQSEPERKSEGGPNP
ncbi:MAG: magnesium transporter MgtE N-terminal domain-containing protein [Nitrospirales bacterium]